MTRAQTILGTGRAGVLLTLLSWVMFAQGHPLRAHPQDPGQLPLEEILLEKRYQEYMRRPSYKDRIDIFRKALEEMSESLQQHLKKKDMDGLVGELERMRALARFALQEPTLKTASAKDQRSKQVKKLEIELRKLSSGLDDFRLAVPFDDRGAFGPTIQHLEELRNQLLMQLFGKAVAPRNPERLE